MTEPKVMVSTLASGNVAPYLDISDIVMILAGRLDRRHPRAQAVGGELAHVERVRPAGLTADAPRVLRGSAWLVAASQQKRVRWDPLHTSPHCPDVGGKQAHILLFFILVLDFLT